MACSAILFDFDYTLADSSRGTVECVNDALRRLGLATHSAEAVCQTIGLSLADTLVKLAGPEQAGHSQAFARFFLERAEQVMAELAVIYPSVRPAVQRLKQHDKRLGIVSTKSRYRIETILQRERLLEAFDVIVGGEDVTQPKPDPEGVCRALDRLGSEPAQTLYVGDSVVDAETAARAGLPFMAVLTGVTRPEAFASYPMLGMVADLGQLVQRLVAEPGGRAIQTPVRGSGQARQAESERRGQQ